MAQIVREFIGGVPVIEFRCAACFVRESRHLHHPDAPDNSLSLAYCAKCAASKGHDFPDGRTA